MATVPAPGPSPAPAPGPAPAPAPATKPKRVRAPKAATPPVVLPATAVDGGSLPSVAAVAISLIAVALFFFFVSVIAHYNKKEKVRDAEVAAKEAALVDREVALVARNAEVAAKEAKLASIEAAMGEEVEVVGVKDGTTIVIKRTEEIGVGPRPKVQLGHAFVVPCEEEKIPLVAPKLEVSEEEIPPMPQPAASVEEKAPQASAPAKPKADWPTETIDGVVEKIPQSSKKARPEPSHTQQPTPRVEYWELRCDQWGNLRWVRVQPMSAQVTPASRDIRYRSRNSNEFQMR